MADPHIKSPMDVWDYATVILYRSGFCLAAPMLFILPWYPETAQIGLLIAATLCASCVHLYMKNFRFHFSIRDVAWSVVSNFGLSTVGVGRGIFSVGRIEL